MRHYLKNDWEIAGHVGYRRVAAYNKHYEWNNEFFIGSNGENGYIFTGWDESKTNLLTVGGEVAKIIEEVRLNAKLDLHFFNSKFYYNAQVGAKYFPASDGKTNINAMASIGSAPETAVCIKTPLIGPKKGEEKEKAETYPYIVVQTEDVKKDVLFK